MKRARLASWATEGRAGWGTLRAPPSAAAAGAAGGWGTISLPTRDAHRGVPLGRARGRAGRHAGARHRRGGRPAAPARHALAARRAGAGGGAGGQRDHDPGGRPGLGRLELGHRPAPPALRRRPDRVGGGALAAAAAAAGVRAHLLLGLHRDAPGAADPRPRPGAGPLLLLGLLHRPLGRAGGRRLPHLGAAHDPAPGRGEAGPARVAGLGDAGGDRLPGHRRQLHVPARAAARRQPAGPVRPLALVPPGGRRHRGAVVPAAGAPAPLRPGGVVARLRRAVDQRPQRRRARVGALRLREHDVQLRDRLVRHEPVVDPARSARGPGCCGSRSR